MDSVRQASTIASERLSSFPGESTYLRRETSSAAASNFMPREQSLCIRSFLPYTIRRLFFEKRSFTLSNISDRLKPSDKRFSFTGAKYSVPQESFSVIGYKIRSVSNTTENVL